MRYNKMTNSKSKLLSNKSVLLFEKPFKSIVYNFLVFCIHYI